MAEQRTEKFGTETADGWYNHIKLPRGVEVSFLAPVKLDFSKRYDEGYKPLRRGSRVVYALPGGGEIETVDPGAVA